jgi:hypothetical protein
LVPEDPLAPKLLKALPGYKNKDISVTQYSIGKAPQDKVFRIGALALASGAAALWGGTAQASLVTETYNLPLGQSASTITIGDGSPLGQPQFEYYGEGLFGPLGTASVLGFFDGDTPKIPTLPSGYTVGSSPIDGYSWLDTSALSDSNDEAFLKGVAKSGGTGYIGLQFDLATGADPYGYAYVNDYNLISITYDTNGNPVNIPPVPEPATLSLLALGAVGVAALRRRRAHS